MQEGDIVKIDLLVEHSGSRKSKDAWNRIKKDFEELAQQTHNTGSLKLLADLDHIMSTPQEHEVRMEEICRIVREWRQLQTGA